MENIPFLIGFRTSQVVIARFLNHQQYFCPKFFPRWIPWGFNPGNRPNCHRWGPQDGEASALLALALTTAEPKVALGGINAILGGMMHQEFNPCSGVDYKRILFSFLGKWQVGYKAVRMVYQWYPISYRYIHTYIIHIYVYIYIYTHTYSYYIYNIYIYIDIYIYVNVYIHTDIATWPLG